MAGVQSNPGISLHPQHCCSCPVSFKYLLPSLLSGTWVSTEQMEAFPWSDLGGISEIWAHFFPTCCWTPLPFTAAVCFGLRLRMCSPPLLYTPLEDDDLEHHHCSWHFINGLPQRISRGCLCSWWCWQEPNEGWLQLSGQRPQQLQDQMVPLGSSAQAVPLREALNTVELRCAFTSSCWAWSKGKQLPSASPSPGRLCPGWEHWIQAVKHTTSSWVMSTHELLDPNYQAREMIIQVFLLSARLSQAPGIVEELMFRATQMLFIPVNPRLLSGCWWVHAAFR